MRKIFILLFVFALQTSAFALDYNVYKLDDGQTVIIKQVKNNPIVTIDTWIKTGSINENDKNSGVSHFLEHLFFKGTNTHPAGEFDKLLESKGAVTNAATSKDFTHYYITIPSSCFDMAIDLHADMLLNPQIPRKELEKERKVVLEEIAKDANNPSNKVYDNFNDLMYTTHPYKRKVLGKGEIIEKITREEILDYYNTHYGPQNMVTVIIGDVDPRHALDKVKEDFKTADVRKLQRNMNKPEKPLTSRRTKIDYEPTQSGYMIIGYRGTNITNPNSYALDVLSTILGDGRASILNQSIKEQKQLAFSISANNSAFKEDGLFMISANFTPEKSEKLQKAIFEEISKLQKQGVTQEQINRAKSIIERDTYYSRESISNISEGIGYTTVVTGNPKYYDEYLEKIKKVTPAEIKHVANLYLNQNKCAISIVLPNKSQKAAEITNSKVPAAAKLVQSIPTTKKYSFENGSTLLISPNELNDIVAISIYAKGGNFLEKIPGTADLTASTMIKGTKEHSSVELAQILEENGIKISPSASADSFSIEILTTKSQLPKTLNLLDEIVNKASFDEYEIEKNKTEKLSAIKKSRDVPMNLALEEYKTLIYEGSVYSNTAKIIEKTLPKIQKDDIVNYYQNIFAPENLVISINGNIETKDVSNKLTEMFSQKDCPQGMFDYQKYSSTIEYPALPKVVTRQIPDLKTAWLILGWQTCGLLNQKDRATLEVIDTILGSGMSSRLFKNVRDQEGLAYIIGSSYSPNVLRGAFTMYIGTNPTTLNLAKEKMLCEVNRLKTEFVSDKELQEAKDKIVGNFVISQETNLEKASTIGWFEASGRGFDFKDKYLKLINEVTASDIIEAANKYFSANFITSTVEGKQ